MAKIIIGIHGLGNKPRKDLLQDWWRMAIIEGLEKIGVAYTMPEFELVYWADILHEKPTDETITNPESQLFLDEPYVPAKKTLIKKDTSVRKKVLDWFDEAADKIFLNNDMTVNYSYISDAIIHNYFKDLEAYYLNDKIIKNGIVSFARDQIRERLRKVLIKHRGDDIFIVSHSMGSIVAYDILTFNLPDFEVHTFATIGSPLGIPFVRSRIALEKKIILNDIKLKTPPGVQKNWFNFSDIEDDVAINYSLNKDFDANKYGILPIDFIVHNDYEINNKPNPHKSFGYLRTPEFSKVLLDFINEKESEKNWKQRIRYIFGILKSKKQNQ
jgi:hypothetical protein